MLTLLSKLGNLRQFFHFLFEKGLLFYDLSLSITLPKYPRFFVANVLTQEEVIRVLKVPDVTTAQGLRDKAILEVFYSTAIRRSELVGLELYDLDLDNQIIKVVGKGRKERFVPVGRTGIYWLENYLTYVRPYYLKDPRDHALFISLSFGRRLHPETVAYLVRKYGKGSGVGKRLTCHTFRHSCATHLLHNGADIRYIQELLGHRSVQSTQVYTHLAISDLKAVVLTCCLKIK